MSSAAYLKNLSRITVFSATSISTTIDSGTPTVVDRRTSGGSGNAIGCDTVVLSANVSVAPSGSTAIDVYAQWSGDGGTTYSNSRYVGTLDTVTATGETDRLSVRMVAPLAKFYLRAPSYTLTAALYAMPEYYEGQ